MDVSGWFVKSVYFLVLEEGGSAELVVGGLLVYSVESQ